MLKKLLLLIGMAPIVSPAWAGPASDKIAQRQDEPFAGYAKTCGYPIIFAKTGTVSLARIDERLGKVIVLDFLLAYPGQEDHWRYMIAHECAHHVLGHTTPEGLRKRALEKGVEDQELSADCWAAEILVKAEAYETTRFMADSFYRLGLVSPGSGYPSGVQRSSVIYHCLKSAQRRQQIERQTPLRE